MHTKHRAALEKISRIERKIVANDAKSRLTMERKLMMQNCLPVFYSDRMSCSFRWRSTPVSIRSVLKVKKRTSSDTPWFV